MYSGTPAICIVPLRSWQTSGRSSGSVSLHALLDGTPARAQRPGSTIPELVDWLCIGGWPAHVGSSVPDAQIARNIATEAETTTIARDASLSPDGAEVGRLTVDDYLDALTRLAVTRAS